MAFSVTGHAGWCHTELGVLGDYWPARDGDRLLQAWGRWDRQSSSQTLLLLYWAMRGCQPGRVRVTVRYCTTPAGRVAYSASGAGPVLLFDSGWITHLRRQLEL